GRRRSRRPRRGTLPSELLRSEAGANPALCPATVIRARGLPGRAQPGRLRSAWEPALEDEPGSPAAAPAVDPAGGRQMRRVIALLGALALTLTLTSCGADSGAGTATTSEAAPSEPAAAATAPTAAATPSEDAFPVTVEAANGAVEISERPERIVSLSPTTTEMLFAVGAGDQVVAVEENSDYPEGVPVTDLSGFD